MTSRRLTNPAVVLPKEFLEKVYFDFLNIFFFRLKKKYISTNRRSPHIVGIRK